MKLSLTCPGCRRSLAAKSTHAGKRLPCPACGMLLEVPAAEPPSPTGVSGGVPQPAPTPASPPEAAAAAPVEPDVFAIRAEPAVPRHVPELGAAHQSAPHSAVASSRAIGPRATARQDGRATSGGRATAENDGPGMRSWWLGAFALALLPLALSMFVTEPDFEQRLRETLEASSEALGEGTATEEEAGPTDEADLFEAFPNQRIVGAHLGRFSWRHWLYALLSASAFACVLAALAARADLSWRSILLAGLVTGTLGIVLLLGFQWVAAATQGVWVRGRGFLTLIFYVVKFIGFSYRCALDESQGFLASFFGFTFGVGLCEELCKALPIIAFLRSRDDTNWRAALIVGLASGVGFGVAEGIIYSSDFYNGVSTGLIYLVRFTSCVSLHAIWAGGVGVLLYYNQDDLHDVDLAGVCRFVGLYLGMSMVLHGLYDTLLKQEHEVLALLTAAASFAWLAGVWAYCRARA